jgi:rRNA-processing protein FCF1
MWCKMRQEIRTSVRAISDDFRNMIPSFVHRDIQGAAKNSQRDNRGIRTINSRKHVSVLGFVDNEYTLPMPPLAR